MISCLLMMRLLLIDGYQRAIWLANVPTKKLTKLHVPVANAMRRDICLETAPTHHLAQSENVVNVEKKATLLVTVQMHPPVLQVAAIAVRKDIWPVSATSLEI